jgi:hypothetical protein
MHSTAKTPTTTLHRAWLPNLNPIRNPLVARDLYVAETPASLRLPRPPGSAIASAHRRDHQPPSGSVDQVAMLAREARIAAAGGSYAP